MRTVIKIWQRHVRDFLLFGSKLGPVYVLQGVPVKGKNVAARFGTFCSELASFWTRWL